MTQKSISYQLAHFLAKYCRSPLFKTQKDAECFSHSLPRYFSGGQMSSNPPYPPSQKLISCSESKKDLSTLQTTKTKQNRKSVTSVKRLWSSHTVSLPILNLVPYDYLLWPLSVNKNITSQPCNTCPLLVDRYVLQPPGH